MDEKHYDSKQVGGDPPVVERGMTALRYQIFRLHNVEPTFRFTAL
jgi:hypothetical protein